VDRGADPEFAAVRREAHARLEAMLDPAAVDARAKARQADLLAANGGREAVIARGDLGFSVPPGVAPMFD
jgi:choline-sulfatase